MANTKVVTQEPKTTLAKKSLMQRFLISLQKYWALYLMMLGGVIYFFIFEYLTLPGLYIVFTKFSFKKGIFGSKFVGLKNFQSILKTKQFTWVLRNTIEISFMKFLLGFPAPIILALLLNEIQNSKFKKIIQSILYLPHFLSWIIMAGICTNLFSTVAGFIPLVLKQWGITMPNLMTDPNYIRPFLYATSIWKGVGWGSIVYMAALAGVDQQLYEAAAIDGCNRLQLVRHVTLPAISVTIVTLMVMDLGGIMSAGFDQIFNLGNDMVQDKVDIIDTWNYRLAWESNKYEWSAVVGLFKAVVNALLLYTSNWITGKISDSSPL